LFFRAGTGLSPAPGGGLPSMWSYCAKGGPVMWPLLLLSILGVAVAIWRWMALRAATADLVPFMRGLREKLVAGDVDGAIKVCEAHPSPVASIVKAGLLRHGRPKEAIERALHDAASP